MNGSFVQEAPVQAGAPITQTMSGLNSTDNVPTCRPVMLPENSPFVQEEEFTTSPMTEFKFAPEQPNDAPWTPEYPFFYDPKNPLFHGAVMPELPEDADMMMGNPSAPEDDPLDCFRYPDI